MTGKKMSVAIGGGSTAVTNRRVLYIHAGNGRSGSDISVGPPIDALKYFGYTVCCIAMDTAQYEACFSAQRDAIQSFKPDVLVGHHFGGALAIDLIRKGVWCGPAVLISPTLVR